MLYITYPYIQVSFEVWWFLDCEVGNYVVWLEINFIRNYLPDLRITEIVLSGEPEANFDALINNTSLPIQNT